MVEGKVEKIVSILGLIGIGVMMSGLVLLALSAINPHPIYGVVTPTNSILIVSGILLLYSAVIIHFFLS